MTQVRDDDYFRNHVVEIENLESYRMRVTTAVIINQLRTDTENTSPEINQQVAFTLLPWKTLKLEMPKRRAKRTKLKNVDFSVLDVGDIFSVRFEGITRGLSRSNSRKYLKNSVSFDIAISGVKYINVKLSSLKAHMCGPQSASDGDVTVQHTLDHIYRIQDMIDYVRDAPGNDEAFEWCLSKLRGSHVARPIYREHVYVYPKLAHMRSKISANQEIQVLVRSQTEDDDGNQEDIGVSKFINIKYNTLKGFERDPDNIVTTSDHHETTLIVPYIHEHVDAVSMDPIDWECIPSHIDRRCVAYFAFNAPRINDPLWNRKSDYIYFEDWVNEATWLRQYTNVYKHRPIYGIDQKAMTNYNFGLGFHLKRPVLAQLFDQHPEFSADFDNMRNQNVMIELPYFSRDKNICRKNPASAVKLIVYKTGKVTLTGPIEAINDKVFVEFVNYVKIIRKQIEVIDDDQTA
jgi:hypothetical protein